jgi:hypothetical protein
MSQSHLHRQQLEALAEGAVDESTRDAWIDHLATCDRCFEAFDSEWDLRLPGGFRVSEVESQITGEMPPEVAERLESKLFSTAHAADLLSSVAWFSTTGFLKVVLCLLGPLVGTSQSRERAPEVDN